MDETPQAVPADVVKYLETSGALKPLAVYTLGCHGHFVGRNHFRLTRTPCRVRLKWMSETFVSYVRGLSVPERYGSSIIQAGVLEKSITESDLMDLVPGDQCISLPLIWKLLVLQSSGGEGVLQTSGSNIFILKTVGFADHLGPGPLIANVWWSDGKGWCLGASPLNPTGVCPKGAQVLRPLS